MSKEKVETEITDENPFGAFSLLKNDTSIFNEDLIETKEPVKKVEDEPISKKKIETEKSKSDEEDKTETIEEVDIIKEVEETKIVEETEEVEEVEEGTFKPFLSHMASKGILDYDEAEEIEDSEEGLEKVVSKTIKNGIDNYIQSKPEDVQKFIDFVDNGGNPKDFHKIYYEEASFKDFKIDTEENQKYVIEQGMLMEGYSKEDIEEEIEDLVDLGKLAKRAEVHHKKLVKAEDEQKELLIQAQKKYAEDQKKLKEQEFENFKKGLFEKETIAGFKITPKVKNDIWDYMTKPIDKKTGVTQYQKDIDEKGAEARYLYAWLMKTNFDITKLEKLVQTKEVSKLKSKLGNYTDSRSKVSKGGSVTPEITDNPFKGFQSLINQ